MKFKVSFVIGYGYDLWRTSESIHPAEMNKGFFISYVFIRSTDFIQCESIQHDECCDVRNYAEEGRYLFFLSAVGLNEHNANQNEKGDNREIFSIRCVQHLVCSPLYRSYSPSCLCPFYCRELVIIIVSVHFFIFTLCVPAAS